MLRLNAALLAWGLAILGMSSLAIWGMQAVGGQIRGLETYLEMDDCRAPCWQGWELGQWVENPSEQGDALSHGRYRVAFLLNDEQYLREIRLNLYGDILLGDVMRLWGSPSHARLRYTGGFEANRNAGRQLFVGGVLYFANGLIEVVARRDDLVWAFSPAMEIVQIRYFAPNPEGSVIPLQSQRWHGFGTDYGQPSAANRPTR